MDMLAEPTRKRKRGEESGEGGSEDALNGDAPEHSKRIHSDG